MLCWLPERKCFLPSLLSELLTASTMFLSSTTPKLDEIKSVDQFGALIGFSCGSGRVKNLYEFETNYRWVGISYIGV